MQPTFLIMHIQRDWDLTIRDGLISGGWITAVPKARCFDMFEWQMLYSVTLRTSKKVGSSRGHAQRSKCASVHSLRCESSIDQLQIRITVDSGPKEYFLGVCEIVTPSARSYGKAIRLSDIRDARARASQKFFSFFFESFADISHNQVTFLRV